MASWSASGRVRRSAEVELTRRVRGQPGGQWADAEGSSVPDIFVMDGSSLKEGVLRRGFWMGLGLIIQGWVR